MFLSLTLGKVFSSWVTFSLGSNLDWSQDFTLLLFFFAFPPWAIDTNWNGEPLIRSLEMGLINELIFEVEREDLNVLEKIFELLNLIATSRNIQLSLKNRKKWELTEAATRCVLRNFSKFTGKHLYQSFFFNKVEGWDRGLQLY